MGDTRISYLQGVWNPTEGCTPASTGCLNCYARQRLVRFNLPITPTLHPKRLGEWLRRRGRIVGVGFQGDLFHEQVPSGFIKTVAAAILSAPQHVYVLLTKRPERAVHELAEPFRELPQRRDPRVYLGVSVESPEHLDRIEALVLAPYVERWVSLEPQVEPVNLLASALFRSGGIRWVVQGCESGPRRRLFEVEWARGARDACRKVGVAYYLKQIQGCTYDDCHCWETDNTCGRPANHPCEDVRHLTVIKEPHLDGRQHLEVPAGFHPYVLPGMTPQQSHRDGKLRRGERVR